MKATISLLLLLSSATALAVTDPTTQAIIDLRNVVLYGLCGLGFGVGVVAGILR